VAPMPMLSLVPKVDHREPCPSLPARGRPGWDDPVFLHTAADSNSSLVTIFMPPAFSRVVVSLNSRSANGTVYYT
jgi:hypothetical protein